MANDSIAATDFAPAATVALPEQTHTFTKFPTSQVDLDMDGDEVNPFQGNSCGSFHMFLKAPLQLLEILSIYSTRVVLERVK